MNAGDASVYNAALTPNGLYHPSLSVQRCVRYLCEYLHEALEQTIVFILVCMRFNGLYHPKPSVRRCVRHQKPPQTGKAKKLSSRQRNTLVRDNVAAHLLGSLGFMHRIMNYRLAAAAAATATAGSKRTTAVTVAFGLPGFHVRLPKITDFNNTYLPVRVVCKDSNHVARTQVVSTNGLHSCLAEQHARAHKFKTSKGAKAQNNAPLA
eukprot:COSAG02_NODE_593_length_19851_cov_13.232736_11_plen_208_part_00